MGLTISVKEAHEKLQQDSCVFLDVRTKEERAICVIEPSLFIPMAKLQTDFVKLPKDKEIVVYCHTGGRSAMATGFLKSKGYNAANLTGGIIAWHDQIDPSIATY